MNIEQLGKGALPDPPDSRDYKLEAVLGAPVIDWARGFDVERELGKTLKRENQGSSLSCVAQAWSKFAEVLELKENRLFTDLSARDLYAYIHQPQGGAYIRDGANRLVDTGVAPEILVASYRDGQPLDESGMRDVTDTTRPEVRQMARRFAAKEYRVIESKAIDYFAAAIRDGTGVVTGASGNNPNWRQADVIPPQKVEEIEWGHAVYCCGYGMRNGKKAIKFLNSWGSGWGENGCGWFGEEWFNPPAEFIFNPWVLIDKSNVEPMRYVIDTKKDQYLLFDDLKVAVSIADGEELEKLRARGLRGEPVPVVDLAGYLIYPGIETARLKDILNL